MSIIGSRIATRRIWLKLNQEELAERAHTTQKQISRFETAKHAPSAEMLVALANALETTTDWLLGLTEDAVRPVGSTADLDDSERQLIEIYRNKTPEQRSKLLDVVKVL